MRRISPWIVGVGVLVLVTAIALIVVFTTRKSGGSTPSNPCAPVLKSATFDAGRSVLPFLFLLSPNPVSSSSIPS
jgi:hypothetical protein